MRKKDSSTFKKIFNFKVEFTSQPQTGFGSKIDVGKNKKIFQLDGGFGGKYLFVNDLQNNQKYKISNYFRVRVPMTEYLLRLSDEIPDIFFTMLVIHFIAMWPRKRMFK